MTKVVVVFGEFVTEEHPEYATAEEAVADGYPAEGSGEPMFAVDAPDDVVTCCYRYDSSKTGDERFVGIELAENECYTPSGIRSYTRELNESASSLMDELATLYNRAVMMIAAGDTAYDWEAFRDDVQAVASEVSPYQTAVVTEETVLSVEVPAIADYAKES